MRSCWLLAVAVLVAGCGGRGRELSPIRLVSMMKLGADSGDGAIATTPMVSARHPGGFRVVIARWSALASPPAVFGDDGRFLGTLRGDGAPIGRLDRPLFTRIGQGDSLWVFDNSWRVLIFDPSRRYVRTIAFSSPRPEASVRLDDAVLLPGGRFAATTDGSAVVHVFDANGAVERDIGAQEFSGSPPTSVWHIALAPDGTLWTTTIYGRWRLEQWDTTGKLLKVIEPASTWLVDSIADHRTAGTRPDQPPPPAIKAIWFDAAGRLWILGDVADRHWREGIIEAGSNRAQHIELDRYRDTIVEVRDPVTGRLIAMARFDIACGSIAEPGVLVHEVDTHAGWLRAELLRIVLDKDALDKPK